MKQVLDTHAMAAQALASSKVNRVEIILVHREIEKIRGDQLGEQRADVPSLIELARRLEEAKNGLVAATRILARGLRLLRIFSAIGFLGLLALWALFELGRLL